MVCRVECAESTRLRRAEYSYDSNTPLRGLCDLFCRFLGIWRAVAGPGLGPARRPPREPGASTTHASHVGRRVAALGDAKSYGFVGSR